MKDIKESHDKRNARNNPVFALAYKIAGGFSAYKSMPDEVRVAVRERAKATKTPERSPTIVIDLPEDCGSITPSGRVDPSRTKGPVQPSGRRRSTVGRQYVAELLLCKLETYKVGSSGNIEGRLSELRVSCPLAHRYESPRVLDNALTVELDYTHKALRNHPHIIWLKNTNVGPFVGGEVYQGKLEDIIEVIKECEEKYGVVREDVQTVAITSQ